MRQMSGSFRLLRILHGVGHIASTATVYRHDTALALLSNYNDDKELPIPRNIRRQQFTTQAWDNKILPKKPFLEKGILMWQMNANSGCTLGQKPTVSKKERTIRPPEINTVPYYCNENISLMFQHEASHAGSFGREHIHYDEQIGGRSTDFLYNIIKKKSF